VRTEETLRALREDVIGADASVNTPFGQRTLLYCDFTASGRALRSIEDFIQTQVLPTYANTHTEVSLTGRRTNLLREQARNEVARACNVRDDSHAVIFVGNGSTGTIDMLVGLLPPPFKSRGYQEKADDASKRPAVLVSVFEHHSNLLPWRESNADVLVCRADPDGKTGVDLAHLRELLESVRDRPQIIGSFNAASNIDGTLTATKAVAALLHEFDALACFDFASSGPYVPIDVHDSGADAIFLSPHKFLGGPGTPGVLLVRRSIPRQGRAAQEPPLRPGGGTVIFTSDAMHAYHEKLEVREEGGTPNIVDAIRCGAVFKVKSLVGEEAIMRKEEAYFELAKERLSRERCPNLHILGNPDAKRLPILSFVINVRHKLLHQSFVCALLNDLFGIQARSGCACAGPYGATLLGINDSVMRVMLRSYLDTSAEILKGGFSRINLPFFEDRETLMFVFDAVAWVAEHGYKLLPLYSCEQRSATYRVPQQPLAEFSGALDLRSFSLFSSLRGGKADRRPSRQQLRRQRRAYFAKAQALVAQLERQISSSGVDGLPEEWEGQVLIPDSLDDHAVWFARRDFVLRVLQGAEPATEAKPRFFVPAFLPAEEGITDEEVAQQRKLDVETDWSSAILSGIRIVRPEVFGIRNQ